MMKTVKLDTARRLKELGHDPHDAGDKRLQRTPDIKAMNTLYTTDEVAEMLGTTAGYVREIQMKLGIKPHKIGPRSLYSTADVVRMQNRPRWVSIQDRK